MSSFLLRFLTDSAIITVSSAKSNPLIQLSDTGTNTELISLMRLSMYILNNKEDILDPRLTILSYLRTLKMLFPSFKTTFVYLYILEIRLINFHLNLFVLIYKLEHHKTLNYMLFYVKKT